MKDVAALCRRVVVIAMGRIVYDGSLAGIIDRFGGHKVVSLQLSDGQIPEGLGRFGEILSIEPPQVKLRVRPCGRAAGAQPHPGRATRSRT